MSTPYSKKQGPCKNFAAGMCSRRNCPFAHVTGSGGGATKGNLSIGGGSSGNQILTTLIKLLFEKAQSNIYTSDERRLNISNFKASPDVVDMVNSIDFNTAFFCDALCAAMADKYGPTGLVIFDVSNNEIRTLTHIVNALKKHGLHTNISAISFANNNINGTDFTLQLQSFPNLQQVVMMGNPAANQPEYKSLVRKRLPNLVGLDKQTIQRPPLSLPWPLRQPNISSEAASMALNFVGSYFDTVNNLGLDNVIDRYHPQAIFSFSFVSEAANVKWDGESASNPSTPGPSSTGGILTSPNRRPLPNKDVLRDVTTLRVKQSEGNHNLMKGVKPANIGKGRAEVVSKLSHLIYQRSFIVDHTFHSSVNATYIPEGGPMAMAVVTMHGYMRWRHRTATDITFTRVFDRTMTLIPNTDANVPLLITNDMVELRPNADDPLCFSDNTERVATVARKFNLPPPIVFTCMTMVGSNDAAWFGLLLELQNSVPVSLLEMVATQLGHNDLAQVVNVARTMARKGINDINQAVQALSAAGGNVDALQ
eukprot:GILI01030081.1.p1 GENE.GILI01030081.1~~GILI01030081.1.p1  ORF type:complete len:537 (-),score=88.93 GILI01030081.1:46-1656(-)